MIFRHAGPDDPDPEELILKKVTEEADLLGKLRDFLGTVSAVPPPPLNFIVGDERMYSKEERKARLRVPLRLFSGLDAGTATQLERRMKEQGFVVKRRAPRKERRRGQAIWGGLGAAALLCIAALWSSVGSVVALPLLFALSLIGAAVVAARRRLSRTRRPLDLPLRPAPAALPASDPLVARLAALLRAEPAPHKDVQEVVRELALLVQRVVDHRLELRAGAAADLVYLMGLLVPIIDQIEAEVRTLGTLDVELSQLDEGTLVRALQRSEARDEPAAQRVPMLDALDRLRTLEDRRGGALHRLLEAASLLRRAADLGLSVQDAETQQERQVQLALAALNGNEG